jgi:hypothetical protein
MMCNISPPTGSHVETLWTGRGEKKPAQDWKEDHSFWRNGDGEVSALSRVKGK